MKNTYYFPHDYHARHDPKLERLFLKMGYEGLGIYWCLIERIYEQSGYFSIEDIPLLSNGNKELCERITNVINSFELFESDDVCIWSNSCIERLKYIMEKSQKASISAQKRWNNANAMPTQCEGNAIKEIKEIKEKKGNKRKEINKVAYAPDPIEKQKVAKLIQQTLKDKDL